MVSITLLRHRPAAELPLGRKSDMWGHVGGTDRQQAWGLQEGVGVGRVRRRHLQGGGDVRQVSSMLCSQRATLPPPPPPTSTAPARKGCSGWKSSRNFQNHGQVHTSCLVGHDVQGRTELK